MKKVFPFKPTAMLLSSVVMFGVCHQEIVKAADAEEVQEMIEEAPAEAVHTVVNENGEVEVENTGDYYQEEADPLDLSEEGQLKTDDSIPTDERTVTGEFHSHTNQSGDASEPYMVLENVLDAAFHENVDQLPEEGKAYLEEGEAFDYYMTADHLRKSPRDVNGEEVDPQPTWKTIRDDVNEFIRLQEEEGKYKGKIYYPGFEWDMFGLDHATVAIVEDGSNRVPIEAYRHFEWLYAYDTPTEAFTDNELEVFGPRDNVKEDKMNSYDGLRWLQKYYPESFLQANHPSRHNGGGGEVRAEDLRDMQDIAPDVVAGFEGMPGNQLGGDRGEMRDIYGGADEMIAKVGGVWDSLLGEGRDLYNYANSDFHFKVSSNELYSSGYWPSEYSRNYTEVEGNTFQDIVKGLKSGNSWSVFGDLISGLDFFVTAGDQTATMGETLHLDKNTEANLTIRFQETLKNNYKHLFEDYESDVTNNPILDHIDLIVGNIYGKVADKRTDFNPTTRIQERFDADDWGQADENGWYSMSLPFHVNEDMYMRLRGTNHELGSEGETDWEGNPLLDEYMEKPNQDDFETEEDFMAALRLYFDQINDRNYSDLWSYSNPIKLLVNDNHTYTVPEVFESAVKDIVEDPSTINVAAAEEPSEDQPSEDQPSEDIPAEESPEVETPEQEDSVVEAPTPSKTTKEQRGTSETPATVSQASVLPETGEGDNTILYTKAAFAILAGLGLLAIEGRKKEY
ncbi:LPXTG cell wall anchor domain-containing protein [Facklamia sp. DSM 111018]|uniref:LPXTG cell wall anchor domain-containing protein n=1 Tax=Facklamia lactis TaxID=2749967 RepID=A0ABS0LU28_9LACT|nr:LPXTG cell wall anchor domain-containing protein [Facklamia lactis]MBG9986881.1 LPXTG cell wall anchor domain-containing protein [Facklamia lactis]